MSDAVIEITVKDSIHGEIKSLKIYKDLLTDFPGRAIDGAERFVGRTLQQIADSLKEDQNS